MWYRTPSSTISVQFIKNAVPVNAGNRSIELPLFTEEPQFDPLEVKRKKLVKASATYFAAILLSIALTESLSYLGILPS